MNSRPIVGSDAATYIAHVHNHGLTQDIAWLLDVGRFPVGSAVLDVGCGTGAFIAALIGQPEYARTVAGVELSPELAQCAGSTCDSEQCTVYHADFLEWTPPAGWQPDTAVMSYFLHHCHDAMPFLRHAAQFLPHGGRLYIVDRVAVDDAALAGFPAFWEQHYRATHEWSEEMPMLLTLKALVAKCAHAGFSFVQRSVCPHDTRPSTDGFPKTLLEFWRHDPTKIFPAVLVVSPAHEQHVGEITEALSHEGLLIASRARVPYSEALIRTIYSRCPWREPLLRFVNETCPHGTATALQLAGDYTTPELLFRLGRFKKLHRDRWPSISGPQAENGFRAIILAFHVAEPYEAVLLSGAIGLPPAASAT